MPSSPKNTIFAKNSISIMTPEEFRIIKHYENMVMWCALNSHNFDDYCKAISPIKWGINNACNWFYMFSLAEELDDMNETEDYHTESGSNAKEFNSFSYSEFCRNRLVEERNFPSRIMNSETREIDELHEYIDNPIIDQELLSYLISHHEPLQVLYDLNIEIEQNVILSYCDETNKQRLLFNALLSLIYNAILVEKDSDKQENICRLLNITLANKIKGDYLSASTVCSILKRIEQSTCRSFFKGTGLRIDQYDPLLSFIDSNNDNDAMKEIIKLREAKFLCGYSRLIEFYYYFKTAQKNNRFLDWHSRFIIGNKDLRSLNIILIKDLQKGQIISQEIVNCLMNGIFPEIKVNSIRRPRKKRHQDLKEEAMGKSYSQTSIWCLPNSAKNVNKERLIDILIRNEWVGLPLDSHPGNPKQVLHDRLNFFFRDGSLDEDNMEMPCEPLQFRLRWNKKPRGKFLHLLIRLLYNQNSNAKNTRDVIRKKAEGKFLAGINDTNVDFLDSSEPIWPIVEKVFRVSARDCKVRKGDRADLVDDLEKLAEDFFSCKNESSE